MDREAIDDEICRIMIEHGPDRHIDGHDLITDFVCAQIAAERERCARIAETVACSDRGCCAAEAAREIRGEGR